MRICYLHELLVPLHPLHSTLTEEGISRRSRFAEGMYYAWAGGGGRRLVRLEYLATVNYARYIMPGIEGASVSSVTVYNE